MAWRIEKLGSRLGAAVTGLDVAAPLDDAAFSELRAAWLRHGGPNAVSLTVREDHDAKQPHKRQGKKNGRRAHRLARVSSLSWSCLQE